MTGLVFSDSRWMDPIFPMTCHVSFIQQMIHQSLLPADQSTGSDPNGRTRGTFGSWLLRARHTSLQQRGQPSRVSASAPLPAPSRRPLTGGDRETQQRCDVRWHRFLLAGWACWIYFIFHNFRTLEGVVWLWKIGWKAVKILWSIGQASVYGIRMN